MSPTRKKLLKWAIYGVILFIFYILQTTPGIFQILGIKPVLLIPLVMAVSLFEKETSAAVFGIVTGFFWDISSGRLPGFSSAILMVIALFTALLVAHLVQPNFINAVLFCAGGMIIYLLTDYFFYYMLWSLDKSYGVLISKMLPMLIYSLIVFIPIFLIIRKTALRLRE